MPPLSWQRLRRNLVWIALLVSVWLLCSGQARAGKLSDRVSDFPNWEHKPPVRPLVQSSQEDLVYPEWMAGTWQMTSTLVDMVAPLAPELVTPGFEGNRQFLNEPITAPVRFVRARVAAGQFLSQALKTNERWVSDRAFNGLSLARAYLGDDGVKTVKIDPDNPNRQVTFLKDDQQLISTVTGRAIEAPTANQFITSEIFQQFFRGGRSGAYLNEVENTTAYYHSSEHNSGANPSESPPTVTADQITAVYLSPRDPDYFKALDSPVALYKYRLVFQR
ncbi:MAG: DUF6816 family protein [Cyanobacteria bacterium P01_A01_bin.114]